MKKRVNPKVRACGMQNGFPLVAALHKHFAEDNSRILTQHRRLRAPGRHTLSVIQVLS